MRAAEDHGDTAGAEVSGELVGPRGCPGDDGHRHEIGSQIQRDVLDPLVDEPELVLDLGRDQRGQGWQREWSVT